MPEERREKPREEFVREWVPVKTNDSGITVSRLRIPSGWLVKIETQLFDFDGSGTPTLSHGSISVVYVPSIEEW